MQNNTIGIMALSRIGSSFEVTFCFSRTSLSSFKTSELHFHSRGNSGFFTQDSKSPLPSNLSPFCAIESSRFITGSKKYTSEANNFNLKDHATNYNQNSFLIWNPRIKSNVLTPSFLNGTTGSCFANGTFLMNSQSYCTSGSSGKTPNTGGPIANKKQVTWLSKDYNTGRTKKERFKIMMRDYGRTVLVFHITISLISLGIFYVLVSSGIDLEPIVERIAEKEALSVIMSQGSTFLIAYAAHKLFAPVRLSITLGCAPLLVRYLRKIKVLKPPAPRPTA